MTRPSRAWSVRGPMLTGLAALGYVFSYTADLVVWFAGFLVRGRASLGSRRSGVAVLVWFPGLLAFWFPGALPDAIAPDFDATTDN